MKMIKKAFAVLLTLAMVMSMCVGAFAAGTTYTITGSEGRTYSVYQIFTGDLAADGKTLSNIKWGKNGKGTEGEKVDAAVLKALTTVTDAATDAEKLAVIEQYADLTGEVYGKIPAGGTLGNVPAGYYLIKETTTDPAAGAEISEYVVKVVADVTIEPKAGQTTFQKKVKDVNDSEEESSDDPKNPTDWQDSADYDIGDDVPFQMTATITEEYANYSTYALTFHDVEATGLTFDSSSVKVYVDGTEITEGYTVNTSPNDGCTFEIVFTDLKNVDAVKAESIITVEYTSELNEKATIGATGNKNKAWATYSNDPNGGTEGKTTEDLVKVFTYELEVTKTNENDDALEGAGFTLYKYDANAATEDKWVPVGTEVTGDGDGKNIFTWTGLDDGKYKIVETTTPDSYNTAEDIEFTITAEHDTESDDPQLTSLTVDNKEITVDKDNGKLTTTVINQKGSELPETGGIGTTIFYVVGGIMVAGAAILLITKKRMGAE